MLARIDPIKWVDDLFCSARNGRGVRLEWIGRDGWDGEQLLRSYGVRVWARGYDYENEQRYSLTVRAAQAKFADGLLRGAGFAVVSPQLSPPITPRSSWGVPAAPQGLAGWLQEIAIGGVSVRASRRRATRSTRRQRARR